MSDSAVEKLVRLEDDSIVLYVKPSKVVAVVDRLMGCDIHVGDDGGKGLVKLFFPLHADEVVAALGLF